jgi:RimJ/RimL family protein N-acetyltransferase
LRWGFTEGGLDRIVSIYERDNVASGRVMERLDFTFWLTTRGTARGREVDVMELTRTRWEERQEQERTRGG